MTQRVSNLIQVYIPLTNQAQGLYRKLQSKFSPFDLWSKREARGPG